MVIRWSIVIGWLSLNQVISGLGKPENVHSRIAGCSTLTVTSTGLPSTFGLPRRNRKMKEIKGKSNAYCQQ